MLFASEPANSRTAGSVNDFERNWQNELKKQPKFAYPSWKTQNQWDLFEYKKMDLLKQVLQEHGLQTGVALEYGCGPAGASVWLANNGFKTFGLDISYSGLKLAEANRSQNLGPRSETLDFIVGNAMQLPFQDASFDFVISNGLLEHFDRENLKLLHTEVMRVLKPGGLFFADIVHGRFSSRTVGKLLNLSASFCYHLASLKLDKLSGLKAGYFDDLYENDLNYSDWEEFLKGLGLQNVVVRVTRPFPPLAIQGTLESYYVKLMKFFYPLWQRFDHKQGWFTKHWGWLYLTWATKPNA